MYINKHRISRIFTSASLVIILVVLLQIGAKVSQVNAQSQAKCIIYAINDFNASRSQLLTIDLYNFNNVQPLGPLLQGTVIEGLDIHPTTDDIYTAGRYSNFKRDSLFKVDASTGALSHVGDIGFSDIEGLAFKPTDSTLWAWEEGKGLLQIDVTTGKGIKSFDTPINIQGIAWSADGNILYAAGGADLWKYNPTDQSLVQIASNLPEGNIEGLDMRPDGYLMITTDGGQGLEVYAYDLSNLSIKATAKTNDATYKDIEAIAWPDSCIIPHVDPSVTPPVTLTPTPTPTSPIVSPPPSSPNNWVITYNGNVHTGGVSQSMPQTVESNNLDFIYETEQGVQQNYFSTYIFSQSNPLSLPSRSSQNNYSLNNYQDSNEKSPTGSDWAKYIGNDLIEKTEIVDINLLSSKSIQGISQVSDISGIDINRVNLLTFNGDVDWNISNCNARLIVYVSGNINISSNLTIDNNQNGCMFLVDGTLTINNQIQSGSTSIRTEYDRVEAFIIANNVILQNDIDGIYIKGGVVANSVDFGRNHPISRNQAFPTEIIDFDTRYMYIYEGIITVPFQVSIKEPQFLRSIFNE